MTKNYFKSYIWLLETLQARGRLTLKEIKDLWMRSSINEDKKELATRTFANHIASIADIFGIDIVCDRRDNTYSIANRDDMDGTGIRSWMLDALSLNSILNESAGMRDRILFENVPSSQKHLTTVIQAIRDGKVLDAVYKSYRKPEAETLTLEPWCLREFKKRWYLFAIHDGLNEPHMYALDRFESMTIGSANFTVPKNFNAHEFFAGVYGTRVYPDMKPEYVIIKTDAMQANYFRSLPLHDSQEEIESGDGYALFRYFLTPDYDFKQDILSFGTKVEVLEPQSLRDEIVQIINTLFNYYSNN